MLKVMWPWQITWQPTRKAPQYPAPCVRQTKTEFPFAVEWRLLHPFPYIWPPLCLVNAERKLLNKRIWQVNRMIDHLEVTVFQNLNCMTYQVMLMEMLVYLVFEPMKCVGQYFVADSWLMKNFNPWIFVSKMTASFHDPWNWRTCSLIQFHSPRKFIFMGLKNFQDPWKRIFIVCYIFMAHEI